MFRLASILAVAAVLPAWHAEGLPQVLARMDEAAANFRDMSGNLKKVTYTAVLNDSSVETGRIRVRRNGPGNVSLLVDVSEPDPKTYALSGRRAEIYFPKIQTVQIYDLGKHANLLDQFLLLGFGTPVKELLKSYDVKLAGEETVEGQPAARLELVPKSPKVREYLAKAELWVSLADGHTLQQKFYEPSGDYRLAVYSDVSFNSALPESALQLKLPNNVKKEYPQR